MKTIVPKSSAERALQFLAIPPSELVLDPDMRSRYEQAYERLGELKEEVRADEAIDFLEEVEKDNLDITLHDSPFSYVNALRVSRAAEEAHFHATVNIDGLFDETLVEQHKSLLRDNTIDLAHPDHGKIRKLFPSGSYFLHSTYNENLMGILSDGSIKSTFALSDTQAMELTNGGSIGVSGNYQAVTNLLGSPKHLAGLIADPLVVLESQEGYFAVPSKSCWQELQYYHGSPSSIDEIRRIENHFGAAQDIFANANLYMAALDPDSGMPDEIRTMIFQDHTEAMNYLRDNPNHLLRAYMINRDGQFRFTDMIGIDGEPITPLTVFLSAVASGCYGEEYGKYISGLRPDEISMELMVGLQQAGQLVANDLDQLLSTKAKEFAQNSAIDVTNTVLYCPKKDYEKWLDVLAKLSQRPMGIIVYNDKDVRVPTAFSSLLPDNGITSLSEQLKVLSTDEAIDWKDLFQDPPIHAPRLPYLVRTRETGTAGVIVLGEDGKLQRRSYDSLYE